MPGSRSASRPGHSCRARKCFQIHGRPQPLPFEQHRQRSDEPGHAHVLGSDAQPRQPRPRAPGHHRPAWRRALRTTGRTGSRAHRPVVQRDDQRLAGGDVRRRQDGRRTADPERRYRRRSVVHGQVAPREGTSYHSPRPSCHAAPLAPVPMPTTVSTMPSAPPPWRKVVDVGEHRRDARAVGVGGNESGSNASPQAITVVAGPAPNQPRRRRLGRAPSSPGRERR